MRITKHEHACLEIELENKTLIIDPGAYTLPLENLSHLVAIVITHEHPDHWTPAHLERLLKMFPGTPIYGPEGVVHAASEVDVIQVAPGDTVTVAPFTLEFFGGTHAVIHESIPNIDNVGVLVNNEFYYPGDSYAVPKGKKVRLLAAPIGAPWLKIGDAMDFVLKVKPDVAFGTHDMTISQIGRNSGDMRLTWAAEQSGGTYVPLVPGDHIDL